MGGAEMVTGTAQVEGTRFAVTEVGIVSPYNLGG